MKIFLTILTTVAFFAAQQIGNRPFGPFTIILQTYHTTKCDNKQHPQCTHRLVLCVDWKEALNDSFYDSHQHLRLVCPGRAS